MPVGLSLLSVFIAPVILLVMWIICLLQVRSVTLTLLTVLSASVIFLTSDGNLLLLQRNPYAMLIALLLLVFTVLMLPHIKATDRPYLIATDSVLLLMFLALHLWRMYLRQSNAYITETNLYLGYMTSLSMVLFTLSIPVLMIINHRLSERRFFYGVRLIGLILIVVITSSAWLIY